MVFAALPERQTGEPPMNPIVTIQLLGRGLAQGETVNPADERGFVRADMHGEFANIAPPEKPTQEVLL